MTEVRIDTETLRMLSRLYSYPEKWPDSVDLDRVGASKGKEWEHLSGVNRLEILQNSYVSLFVNTLPEIPCPPYGSFYLEGVLMGASTVQVNNIYNEYGFLTEEVPDYIAAELEFLAILSTIASHDPVQQDYDFLLKHLRQWTPTFFEQVEKNDDMGFYREVCRYARQVIC